MRLGLSGLPSSSGATTSQYCTALGTDKTQFAATGM